MNADFILPLGPACRPAWHLKLNNLRYVSSPFDWMMSYKLETFIKFVKQKNLKGFFETNEYLNRDLGKTRVVRDTVNGIVSMHSFPVSMEIQDFYPSFIQIMSKRFDRLLKIFEQSKTIVFLSNRNEYCEIKNFLCSFNELYPVKDLVYINVEHSPEEKEYRESEEKVSDNILIKHVYFNDVHINRDTKDNPRFWLGNEEGWTKLCSTLNLENPQTIQALNEDKELR